jgi:hypothetical protein
MDRLLIVKEGGWYKWACCNMTAGACYKFKGLNIEVCKGCEFQRFTAVSKSELAEFLIDEELSKIIMAGTTKRVSRWLFCTHYMDALYSWAGCDNDGGCCSDVYWSRDRDSCNECEHQRVARLDHKGFEVGLDNNGQITIKKEQ